MRHFFKIILLFFTIFPLISVYGQNGVIVKEITAYDGPNFEDIISTFTQYVKNNDSKSIAAMTHFPLNRYYPIPNVKDASDFLQRYPEIFDEVLRKKITQANIKSDWIPVGVRGLMLQNGVIWLNADGSKLIAVNYESDAEKNKRLALISEQKKAVHKSLGDFLNPIGIWQTKNHRIRIDEMAGNDYRYASWKTNTCQSDKPDMILKHGTVNYDGSGGNHAYTFKGGGYIYHLDVMLIGLKPSPSATLVVLKDGKEVSREEAQPIGFPCR
ncbi:MAG: hypothetical protein K0Q74_644 [Gammaproteobacteria bacterium]|nr:hypothetical protein [Gammaproteobacteria bacterium]